MIKLLRFIKSIKNIYPSIKFAYEIESNNKLPFLDVLSKTILGQYQIPRYYFESGLYS